MKQKIYAHRGASGYAPENTLEAFILAAKMGAHGVELDVHLTRDEEIVVTHDESIERVSNGTGYIRDLMLTNRISLTSPIRNMQLRAYRRSKRSLSV